MSDDKTQPKPETGNGGWKQTGCWDQKVFGYYSKFPEKIKEIGNFTDDIDICPDNTETNKIMEKLDDLSQTENKQLKELKSKKTLTAKQANTLKEQKSKRKDEYSFKFYGERKNTGFKRGLSIKWNNYVSDSNEDCQKGIKNTSFIDCIEELSNITQVIQKDYWNIWKWRYIYTT